MSLVKNGNPLPKCPGCGSVSTRKSENLVPSIETRICNSCGKTFDIIVKEN